MSEMRRTKGPECADVILQKSNSKDGTIFWGRFDYSGCNWKSDNPPASLPKTLLRVMDSLPQQFLDWIQQNHSDLLEHYDRETWNDLYWHVVAVLRNDCHPDAVLLAIVQEDQDRASRYVIE